HGIRILPLLLIFALVFGAVLYGSGRVSLPELQSVEDRARALIHPETIQSYPAIVTDGDVNLRSAASLDADVVEVMQDGEDVIVTGKPVDGFLPVEVDGQKGWVSVDFIGAEQTGDSSQGPDDGDQPQALDVPAAIAQPTDAPIDAGIPVVADTDTDAAIGTDTAVVDQLDAPRPVPTESPRVVALTPDERWIDVDRTTATVTLYVGTIPQATFQGKIGRDPAPDGFYSTAIGTFHVFSMEKGLAPTPFVDDVYMTDWVGFDPVRKNGFHSPVREADGSIRDPQNPTTMGCVRLGADDAVTLFDFAAIGMRVEIHD
ncbi:MAG TPA: SH3 domain-containing protein, partial [Thermomicrobiales bacterium]|nr:SH3 domain-containing protein [Thermomicrobiales bacterium]